MAPDSQARVLRFTRSERAIHWIVAIAFFSMLSSGLAMGHRGAFHDVMYAWHLTSAAILLLGIAAVAVIGDRRALVRTGRQLRTMDGLDRAWLASVPGAVLTGRAQPPAGRFNAGQKVNFTLVSLLLAALFVSGVGLVLASSPPSPIFKAAHVVAAYLSVILVVGHLYMALINPGTRPALSGIITGTVDHAWLREHHARATNEDGMQSRSTRNRSRR
jgi:formate dehydrogenase subunit gamma